MEVGSGRNGAVSRNLALSDTYLVFIKNGVIEGLLWCPPEVSSQPSRAGDVGLIPGGGTKIPQAAGQLLSPWATTGEPECCNECLTQPNI